MNILLSLTRKDVRLLFHDKTSMVLTFLLPIVLVALIGSAFSNAFPPSLGISSFDYAFSKVMFWGLMGGVASSVGSLTNEKTSGTMLRLQLAPVRRINILAGKALSCIFMVLVSTFICWLFATLVFGIKTNDPLALVIVCVVNAIFFGGLMTFLSNFVHTERAAGALSWAVLQVLACFSGIMFPVNVMPPWMAKVTTFNPVTWAVKSMEIALWKSSAFSELMVPVSIVLGSGLLLFIAGAYLFQKK